MLKQRDKAGRRFEEKSSRFRRAGGFSAAVASGLQRLDLHLAELDDTLVIGHTLVVLDAEAVLQGDPSAGKLGVLHTINGLLAVEDDSESGTLRRNLIDVPLAAGLWHRIDLGEVDDGTRAVAGIWAHIPDVDLIRILGRYLLGEI